MPYVITTTTPDPVLTNGEHHHDYPGLPCGACGETTVSVSCVAVATLDEAKEAVERIVNEARETIPPTPLATVVRGEAGGYSPTGRTIAEIPESGGTVGPLPDGSTITVERVSEEELISHIPHAVITDMWLRHPAVIPVAELCEAFTAAKAA